MKRHLTLISTDEVREMLQEIFEMLDGVFEGTLTKKGAEQLQSKLHGMINQLIPMAAYASVLIRETDRLRGRKPATRQQKELFNAWADTADVLAETIILTTQFERLYGLERRA